MASFEIRWRSSTKKDLRSLPREEVSRIIESVAKLAEDPLPHGSQKLAGADHVSDPHRRLSGHL
jgi:mRNA interferase RelE/StbE